ncbi:MAG: hypothetical protein AAF740_08505, partial [Bacteroidota bacterium]
LLILSNVFNALWCIVWVQELIGFSVIMIIGLLLSLIYLTARLRLEIWDAPLSTIAFVWWPICIYLGWVTLATAVNISAFLTSLGWSGEPFSAIFWAITVMLVAGGIYLFLIRTRNLREAAMVGVWGVSAIAVKQWDSEPIVAWAALGVAAVLFIAASIHAAKNWRTSPIQKVFDGDWK